MRRRRLARRRSRGIWRVRETTYMNIRIRIAMQKNDNSDVISALTQRRRRWRRLEGASREASASKP